MQPWVKKRSFKAEDMRNYLYQYLPGKNDQILVPAGLPEAEENRATAKYTSGLGENQYSGEAIAVVSDRGIACVFFTVGPLEYESYYSKILNDLSGSLEFSSIEQKSEVP